MARGITSSRPDRVRRKKWCCPTSSSTNTLKVSLSHRTKPLHNSSSRGHRQNGEGDKQTTLAKKTSDTTDHRAHRNSRSSGRWKKCMVLMFPGCITPTKDVKAAGPAIQPPKSHLPSTPQAHVTPPTPIAERTPSTAPGTPTPAQPAKGHAKRPSLLSRGSTEKLSSDGKSGPRRSSWLNNISSKFSSQQQVPTVAQYPSSQPSSTGTTPPATPGQAIEESEEVEPYYPSKPKDQSFFSSLTRRLSSASQTGSSPRVQGTKGLCHRRILNLDPNRERCLVPEMDQSKLRKVSFCVDVEIAGGPRYRDDSDDEDRQRRRKDFKAKERAEGEALKHPQALQEVKDVEEAAAQKAAPEKESMVSDAGLDGDQHDAAGTSRKKEKKKRSEEERKERKEKRKRRAEESGAIPVEMSMDNDDEDLASSPELQQNANPASQLDVSPPVGYDAPTAAALTANSTLSRSDRPTTDPVRIYRRCCQLRETPILKRITEQLMSPTCTLPNQPGVVGILDLTRSRLQLADFVTLGDWLAVVPVKHLRLEDADMNDEALRCVLAGLLAAKRPEPSKRKSADPKHRSGVAPKYYQERTGVVEKLSLKNNARITRQGWKHISLFIYMCRSIKAIDLSMIEFPETLPPSTPLTPGRPVQPVSASKQHDTDAAGIFYKCLAERWGGSRLDELIMSECSLSAAQIRMIVDGAIICGISRLGLSGNHIEEEGLHHVLHYLRSGVCQGLDIGGNDLRGKLGLVADALHARPDVPCWGLSLAGCNLDTASLKPLFPALVKLPNFRFIDLSHNRDLCTKDNGTISLFRRYMGQLKELKRVHLADVGMNSMQAIALADVLPEGPMLAHLNILENPELKALAHASDEANQEEACALYASLMAAVRVSSTLICIDIDVPTQENSEVVKALAKQVVAYSLRNMEQFAIAEATGMATANATARLTGPHGGEKQVKQMTVPDVLMHLVGHVDDGVAETDNDDMAPDEDYIVGGTGVVKALQYVLGEKANDLRRGSIPNSPRLGSMTPRERPGSSAGLSEMQIGKAKKMSKNLLDSARRIRTRLQPALVKEAASGDELAYRRLMFLDQTLSSMIQRFEEEFPETRIASQSPRAAPSVSSSTTEVSRPLSMLDLNIGTPATDFTANGSDEEVFDDEHAIKPSVTRHNSDVSLAARALGREEGHLHRLGQHLRREVMDSPVTASPQGASSAPWQLEEQQRIRALGEKIEGISGTELRTRVANEGWVETLKKLGANYDDLRMLQEQDPQGWEDFKESQYKARLNVDQTRPGSPHYNG
nr:map-likeous protein 1 [Quercus suber]